MALGDCHFCDTDLLAQACRVPRLLVNNLGGRSNQSNELVSVGVSPTSSI